MAATFALGADQLAALIRESPAANHLLPLTTRSIGKRGRTPESQSKSGRSRRTCAESLLRFGST